MTLLLIAPVWILVLAVIGGLCVLGTILIISWYYIQRNSKTYVPDFTEMALDMLRDERREQITKHGFMSDRDDKYHKDELAIAAACYLYAPRYPYLEATGQKAPHYWPWSNRWKPQGGRIKQLQKGGGLLLAEIERQLRKQWYEQQKSPYATNSGTPGTGDKGTSIHTRRPGGNSSPQSNNR